MNPTEQKNHKTKMQEIEAGVVAFTEETVKRLDALGADITRTIDYVNEERTARLKMAEEQRAYVDCEDRRTRHEFGTFYRRGFWSRLNWLLRGR